MSEPKATHSVTPICQKSKTKFIVKVAKSKVPQAYTTRNTQGNRTRWGNEMKVKIIKDTQVRPVSRQGNMEIYRSSHKRIGEEGYRE